MIKVEQNKQNSFFFEIKPNRSLYGTQRVIFFTLLFSTCLIIGLAFFILGATLILPFAGLEIFFVSLGFYANFKWSRQKEVIYLSQSKVKIEKGRIFRDFVWEEFRAFVKFQIKKTNNETNKLFFSSKGKHIEVGNFLNQEQKKDLIKEIRSAISFLNSLDP